MTDTRELLERAGRSAPPAITTSTRFSREGSRKDRGERIRAGALGVMLAILGATFAFVALDGDGPGDPGAGVTGSTEPTGIALPPSTEQPLVAGDGQYLYRAVLYRTGCPDVGVEVCGGNDVTLDATTWWSPGDDSGRVEVDARENYGIDEGRFEAGAFPNPNGIDVSSFPLEPGALTSFLLERSAEGGSSPAPLVTPPPEGAPTDGQLWRAVTDLLADPHVTPAVRAALLDVAAGLQGAHVTTDTVDPFGRPAHIVAFGNWGGAEIERLYVDPATHELLVWTSSLAGADLPFAYYVVQGAGVTDSIETGPTEEESSVPWTLLSAEDLAFG